MFKFELCCVVQFWVYTPISAMVHLYFSAFTYYLRLLVFDRILLTWIWAIYFILYLTFLLLWSKFWVLLLSIFILFISLNIGVYSSKIYGSLHYTIFFVCLDSHSFCLVSIYIAFLVLGISSGRHYSLVLICVKFYLLFYFFL